MEQSENLPRLAWAPVTAIGAGTVALLLAYGSRYDYHRDELYFRMLGEHLSWGYVDQPPLTPLLGRLAVTAFGDTVWALRVPSALFIGIAALLLALLARQFGGGTGAQCLAASGSITTYQLACGHTFFTNAPDLVIWLLVSLFALRALAWNRPRYWLAVGVTVGLGTYNKYLVALLLLTLATGIVLVGPRRALASRYLLAGIGLAVLVGSPNLIYQLSHGFPQLDMASEISHHEPAKQRELLVPMQLLLLIGPALTPVWVAGMFALFREPKWRAARGFAVAYPILCLLVLALPGHYYYPIGLLYVLFAAGCVPTMRWAARHRGRREALAAALVINMGFCAVMTLPILPLSTLVSTPIPQLNQAVREQIGWPAYVRQIADAYHELSERDQANAVVIAHNYGEAGAVDRYGAQYGLSKVYSGHNALYYLGRPPDSAAVAVVVYPDSSSEVLSQSFEDCQVSAYLHSSSGIDNSEEGTPIYICRGPRQPWTTLWPSFRHN